MDYGQVVLSLRPEDVKEGIGEVEVVSIEPKATKYGLKYFATTLYAGERWGLWLGEREIRNIKRFMRANGLNSDVGLVLSLRCVPYQKYDGTSGERITIGGIKQK